MSRKILLLSTRDSEGGATEWFFNLAKTLNKAGYNIIMVVAIKKRTEPFITNIPIRPQKKTLYQRSINFLKGKLKINDEKLQTVYDYAFFPGERESDIYISAEQIISEMPFVPDIIISGLVYGFVNTGVLLDLKKITNARVYQTTFDASSFTGGCHILWECDGFKKDCSNCPGVKNNKSYASENFKIKKRNIDEGNFGILLGPGWAFHMANVSSLYKNAKKVKIGTCIDTNFFTNKNRDIAKRIFDLPESSKVIFAGASDIKDKRKGLSYLLEALEYLWNDLTTGEKENIHIVMVIKNSIESELVSQIKFRKTIIEYITDYRLLTLLYQAADVYVCSSIEDTGPMMVPEAMSCGTPVVGFEMGLLYDDSIVVNGHNGFRVKLKDSLALSKGIKNIIKISQDEFNEISNAARESIKNNLSEEYFLASIEKL